MHEYIVHSITKSNLLQHLTKTTVTRHTKNLAISQNTCPSDMDMHRATVDSLFLRMRMCKKQRPSKHDVQTGHPLDHRIQLPAILQSPDTRRILPSLKTRALLKHGMPRPTENIFNYIKNNSAALELQTQAGGLPNQAIFFRVALY